MLTEIQRPGYDIFRKNMYLCNPTEGSFNSCGGNVGKNSILGALENSQFKKSTRI